MNRCNALNSGHRACQGCGEALGARYAVDAAIRAVNGNLAAANATGCLEVFSTPYPETSWQLPWFHSLFGNTAAVATGMAAAFKVRAKKAGVEPTRVIAMGGDGGTTDIGVITMKDNGKLDEKIIAIPFNDPNYNTYHDISDLPHHLFQEMQHFFTVYKTLENKETVVDEAQGRDEALKVIRHCYDNYLNSFCR